MAHAFVEVFLAVAHFKVWLPPKILIVQRVVFVEHSHIFCKPFNALKVCHVDEGMRWRYSFVMVVEADDDRQYGVMHHPEKSKKVIV